MTDHTKQFYEYDERRQGTYYEERIDKLEAKIDKLKAALTAADTVIEYWQMGFRASSDEIKNSTAEWDRLTEEALQP